MRLEERLLRTYLIRGGRKYGVPVEAVPTPNNPCNRRSPLLRRSSELYPASWAGLLFAGSGVVVAPSAVTTQRHITPSYPQISRRL